jgi:transcriptional regulator with XRE-family HTH domain
MTTLPHFLKTARIARGWTIRELGTAAGVSASHVARAETGASDPTFGMLAKILGGLGLTLRDLAAALEPPPPPAPVRRPRA